MSAIKHISVNISFLIGDQLTVGRIKELVAKMKSEKAELHPFPADKSH